MNAAAHTTVPLLQQWPQVVAQCRRSFASSMHFALATVNADGSPQVTPIGSLLPTAPGRAIYLDLYAGGLRANLDRDPRVCVLAVDSGRWTWLRALLRDRFEQPPGLRLHGRAGPRRPATAAEIARWRRRVGWLLRLPGGRTLWGHESCFVRELEFDALQPVRLGSMTR